MLARQLLIGVMALATLPVSHAPQQQTNPVRILLARVPLSDDITALTVIEHPGMCVGTKRQAETGARPPCIQVELTGPAVHEGASSPNRLSVKTTQVWLLRTDGTAVGNLIPPMDTQDFVGAVSTPYRLLFTFQAVPPQDLAGVVVSENGTLFVREIKAS